LVQNKPVWISKIIDKKTGKIVKEFSPAIKSSSGKIGFVGNYTGK
jgi:hypothetical protein